MISRIRHFHDEAWLIEFAQSVVGRLVIVAIAFALLIWHDTGAIVRLYLQYTYQFMIVALVLVMLLPSRKREMVSLASFGMMVSFTVINFGIEFTPTMLVPGTPEFITLAKGLIFLIAMTAGLYVAFFLTQRFERLPPVVRRYPVISFHILVLTGLFLIGTVPALFFLAGFVWLVPFLIWRISYMILDASRGKSGNTGFGDHLLYLVPVFGGQELPFAKGYDYLSRHDAESREALARSQLAGLRLMIIGILWHWTGRLMEALVYGKQAAPADLLGGISAGLPLLREDILAAGSSIALAWASLYLELFRLVLQTAAWGAIIVGCVRLLGFNVFRNTYKPLLAETVLDFWGRFSYYFKEICLDFFFYPTFLRCGWAGPRLRLFLAVFAAAFLGNLYFHLLFGPNYFLTLDWSYIWAYWSPRIIYCALLTLGIWISMLRQQSLRKNASTPTSAWLRARRIFAVWTFYSLIHVFNFQNPDIGIGDRLAFCAALIGL